MNKDKIISNIKGLGNKVQNMSRQTKLKCISGVCLLGIITSGSVLQFVQTQKIHEQGQIIAQNESQIKSLQGVINNKESDINSLKSTIEEFSIIEEGYKKNIEDLGEINLRLQNEKLILQDEKDKINNDLTQSNTRLEYLEKRNKELTEEVKKNP